MNPTIAIVGTGDDALNLTRYLIDAGFRILHITNEAVPLPENEKTDGAPVRLCASINACRGTVGDFELGLYEEKGAGNTGDATAALTWVRAHAVIITDQPVRTTGISGLGLPPATAESGELPSGFLTLSQVRKRLENPEKKEGAMSLSGLENRHILFLFGIAGENRPEMLSELYQTAEALQKDHQVRCSIVAGNLKVAGPGLETDSHRLQAAGIRLFKPDPAHLLFQVNGGENQQKPQVSFFDPSLRETVQFEPDVVVLDEYVNPSPALNRLASVLGLETDGEGYIQSDNVHRLPVLTNRKGIFAIGSARGCHGPDDIHRETAIVHWHLTSLFSADLPHAAPHDIPEINTRRCVRCLTCFRICPHRAIIHHHGDLTITSGCYDCRICVAECPRQAITPSVPAESRQWQWPKPDQAGSSAPQALRLAVFGCKRSIEPAMEKAREQRNAPDPGTNVTIDWTPLPCAGGITEIQILSALKKGADRILVLTCHPGNCHSGNGDHTARQHVSRIEEIGEHIGLNSRRLEVASLAANMGAGFANHIKRFVADLDPSRSIDDAPADDMRN